MRNMTLKSLIRASVVSAVITCLSGIYVADASAGSTPPYNKSSFRAILNVSKLQHPQSGTKIAQGKMKGASVKNRFYLRSNSVMTFVASGDSRRTELRLEYEFRPNKGTNRIYGRVRPTKPSSSGPDQYTFLQLHEYKGAGPVCRIAWRKSRKSDYIWAVVRQKPGSSPKWYALAKRSSSFQDFELRTNSGKLRVKIGGVTKTYSISGYNNRNLYWKAGAYNQDSGNSKSEFSTLRFSRQQYSD